MSDLAEVKKPSLLGKFSERYAVDANKMFETLKSTAFKQRDGSAPSNEQMMALLVVADQYHLNPFTREIYAFPDKQNGIVPVVGVDGWSRIINSHPQFDGMEFNYSDATVTPIGSVSTCHEWVECVMYRKDRSRPVIVREYLDEVYRAPFKDGMKGPWQTHTKRFLRHKAMIQCARLAFGFVGIFDQDEAERIEEQREREVTPQPKALPECADEQVMKHIDVIRSGNLMADDVIATLSTKFTLSEAQIRTLRKAEPIDGEFTHEAR